MTMEFGIVLLLAIAFGVFAYWIARDVWFK